MNTWHILPSLICNSHCFQIPVQYVEGVEVGHGQLAAEVTEALLDLLMHVGLAALEVGHEGAEAEHVVPAPVEPVPLSALGPHPLKVKICLSSGMKIFRLDDNSRSSLKHMHRLPWKLQCKYQPQVLQIARFVETALPLTLLHLVVTTSSAKTAPKESRMKVGSALYAGKTLS